MPRVLYVLESLGMGGTEQSVLEIAGRLRAAGAAEPVVAYLTSPSTLAPRYRAAGIQTVPLALHHPYRFAQGVERLLRLMRVQPPDLIHTATFAANVAGRTAGRIARVPVVSSVVGDTYAAVYREKKTPLARAKHQVVQTLDRSTARWVRRFAANSHALAASTVRDLGVDADRIEVIHRGRDPKLFAPGDASVARVRLGVRGRPLIMSVGRLKDIKAHEDLIEASTRLRTDFPRLETVIVGEGNHRAPLERLIKKLNAPVRLVGLRQDVSEILSAADVFVSCSTTEGHPGAVVEAMLAGRAVVLSDIAVHVETIDNGRGGWTFPVRNVDALTSVLQDVLRSEERTSRAEMGRAFALEHYDIKNVVARHEALYAQVLAAS